MSKHFVDNADRFETLRQKFYLTGVRDNPIITDSELKELSDFYRSVKMSSLEELVDEAKLFVRDAVVIYAGMECESIQRMLAARKEK